MNLIASHFEVDPFECPSNIYIHYPVCKHVCSYCDFTVISQAEAKSQFASHINSKWLTAIENHFEFMMNSAIKVQPWKTIYFGGGTPTLLSAKDLEAILEILQKNGIESDCEITIEANPETVSLEYLKDLKAIGINRLSLGVQTTKASQLRRLERLSTSERVKDAVESALRVFSNINIDLMIGIPEQTFESLLEDLQFIKQMNPQHVSAYILTLSPDHIWFKNSVIAPTIAQAELVEKLYLSVIQFLESEGYFHYEVSNFSKPGFQSKHNQNYWNTDSSYLALGPGAHAYLKKNNGERFRTVNEKHLDKYFSAPEIYEAIETLNNEQKNLEKLYMKLRTRQPLTSNEIPAQKLQQLLSEGLCCAASDGFILSDRGWLTIEKVAEYIV